MFKQVNVYSYVRKTKWVRSIDETFHFLEALTLQYSSTLGKIRVLSTRYVLQKEGHYFQVVLKKIQVKILFFPKTLLVS